jgi:glycosyltransferase involved in cell wall biosynthesis
MPEFHIAMTWAKDYDEIDRLAALGQGPRHAVPALVHRLGAILHQANRDAQAVSRSDRLRSRLIGTPNCWAFARDVAPRLGSGAMVYCLDAEVGVPLAAALRRRSSRPKLAVFLHNLDRPRGRLASRLLRVADTVDLFISCCSSQLEFVRDWLKVSEDRTFLLLEHLDNRFFTPGPPDPGKTRPVIAAVGLERRDYRTLAAATRDLNADVRVAGWSAYARKLAKTLPPEVPANMALRSYKPTELVQLYRDADVVVVSMFPNKYAGITALIEGLACGRPVVATRTRGLVDYLAQPDGISVVEPGDPAAMREAIVRLLEHPDEARAQAHRGYESAGRRYDFDRYIETVARRLEAL